MPIIKMGYGYGLWGLGEATTPNSQPGANIPATYGFVDGLRVWTTPSQILPAFGALGAMFQAAPMAAVGFLAPPAVLLLLVAGGGGFVAGRRRARRGNPGHKSIRSTKRRMKAAALGSGKGSWTASAVRSIKRSHPKRSRKR